MTRSTATWIVLLAVLLSIGGARTAAACKCGRPRGAFVTGPYVDVELGLQLRTPSVAVRCEGLRKAPRCEYEARYVVHNPSASPVRGAAVVLGSNGTEPQVWLDRVPVASREPEALDERATNHARKTVVLDPYGEAPPLARRGFVIEVPAQASVEVRVTTPITPTEDDCDCGQLQIERWHLLVSRRLERNYVVEHVRGFGFDGEAEADADTDVYAVAPRNEVEPPIEQITEVPLRWSMTSMLAPHPRRIHGLRWEGRRTRAAYEGRNAWDFGARPPVLWGGPFAAVGVGWRDKAGLALRAGWEVARPAWLVTSVAVESDARSYVSVVPALEGTFPYWGQVLNLFPAPAVGVGAPIQVWPEPRFAVRAQVRLGWHVLSIVGVMFVYPEQAGWAGDLRGALLFQIGV
jgi:hypothetical protein